MAQVDENHVRTCDVTLIWDGITRPETTTEGTVKHNVRCLINFNSPEYQEMNALATKALNESKHFRGQLPANGNWPFNTPDLDKLGAEFAQCYAFTASTYNGAPEICDTNGRILTPMELQGKLYPGCTLQLIVHAFDYNNKTKGIGFGLDGMMIVDSTRPKLAVAGGMSTDQMKSAFGFQPGAAAAPGPGPAAQQPPAPGPGPAVQQPPAPGPGPAAQQPPAPAPEVPNAQGFSQGHVMTDKANGVSYEAFIAKGWTDEMLRSNGYMY